MQWLRVWLVEILVNLITPLHNRVGLFIFENFKVKPSHSNKIQWRRILYSKYIFKSYFSFLTQISVVLKQKRIFARSLCVPFVTLSGFRPIILIITRATATFSTKRFARIFFKNHQFTKWTGPATSDLESNLENQFQILIDFS